MVMIMGCKQSTNKNSTEQNVEQTTKEEPMEVKKTLTEELNEKKSNFNLKADETKKAVYADGIESVIKSKIVETALQVGDTAINFTLTNANGTEVSLYSELEKGPVILMWYRGGWCPYCNLTLHYMQEMIPEFKKYSGNLIALTPEVPDKSLSTKEKNELTFEVLSDLNSTVAKQYGIVFKLTDEVAEYYQNGFDLQSYNGNDNNELPLAATYVIDTNKVIKYAFLDADYRNRAEPSVVLEALKEIAK